MPTTAIASNMPQNAMPRPRQRCRSSGNPIRKAYSIRWSRDGLHDERLLCLFFKRAYRAMVCAAIVLSLTGCITADSGRKAAHYDLYLFEHSEVVSFLGTLGYPSGSYSLQDYDRDESGNELRFWLTNRSNGTTLVLVVPTSGDIKAVPVPSPRSYLNSDGECAAWIEDNVLRLASGKSVELAPTIYDSGLDRTARYCYFVRKDPDLGGMISRMSEIVALTDPDRPPVRLDGYITGIFTHEGKVFALCIDFARGPENEWGYAKGVICYTYVETPAGLNLENREYIQAPSRFTVSFTWLEMDAQNGWIYFLREFDAPEEFLSPRFIYDMQARKLVRIGHGSKRGLFLRDDIMSRVAARTVK